jgi:hypothetical protein
MIVALHNVVDFRSDGGFQIDRVSFGIDNFADGRSAR